MSNVRTYQNFHEATNFIQSKSKVQPKVGLILGSGLGSIADLVKDSVTLPYSQIPHFHSPQVEGHAGQMVLGFLNEVPVVLLQGRFHFYEGHSMRDVAFPTRILCQLGIQTLIVTNAAGGINTRFRPGDLMLIEDHINFMGDNPLMGPHLAEFGPRFPDLTEAYHKGCLDTFKETAVDLNLAFQTGTYAAVRGPSYETPAEVRMLRVLGADAVGMSTVPETIVANHMGVKVAGISCITNLAAGLSPHKLSHQEVMETSRDSSEKMKLLISTAIPRLS